MGKKNNVLVGYFENSERFADICNAFYYGGEPVIRPQELEEASEKYDAALVRDERKNVRDTPLERIRDIKKVYHGKQLRILGLEDMDSIDYTVGVRNMQYDAMEYARQLERIKTRHRSKNDYASSDERLCGYGRDDRLMAVQTLWLYHGARPYDGPRSLREMLDLGEEVEGVADYPVNLLCVDEMLNTEIFRTEVKQLFQAMQCRGDKEALRELFERDESFQNLEADTVEAIAVALERPGLWKNREKYEREEGRINMCKAMDDWEAEAREEGRFSFGCESIRALMETMKWTAKQAMDAMQIPEEQQKQYAARL